MLFNFNKLNKHKNSFSHIAELRRRLLWISSVFIGFSCVSYFFAEEIFIFLAKPLLVPDADVSRKFIYTGIFEAFFTYLKIAMASGFGLSLPIAIYHLWRFISPGLFKNERYIALFVIFSSFILFLLGIIFAYYIVFPQAWEFFLSFEADRDDLRIVCEPRMKEYFSLMLKTLIGFGIGFQFPLAIMILVGVGIISLDQLRRNRRYVLLMIIVVSAVITPPDIVSPLLLTAVLYCLYEIGLFLMKIKDI